MKLGEINANTLKVGVTTSQANAIIANTAKLTNANHTGEVTGSGALTVQPTLISGKTVKSVLAGTEEILVNDGGTFKKVLASNFVGDTIFTGGTMLTPSTISMAGNDLIFSGGKTKIDAGLTSGSYNFELTGGEAGGGGVGISLNNTYNVNGQPWDLISNQDGNFQILDRNDNAPVLFFNKHGATWQSHKILGNNSVGTGLSIQSNATGGNAWWLMSSANGSGIGGALRFYNGTYKAILTSDAKLGINIGSSAPLAQFHVKGSGSTSSTTALLVQNSLGTDLLEVKDDGTILGNFGVDTIYTGGTMSSPSTIAMAGNDLTFDGGKTIFRGDIEINEEISTRSSLPSQIHSFGTDLPTGLSRFFWYNNVGLAGYIDLLGTAGTLGGNSLMQGAFRVTSGGNANKFIIGNGNPSSSTYFIWGGAENANTDGKWDDSGLLIGNGIGASSPAANLHVTGEGNSNEKAFFSTK